ncbi:MAG TPA: TolC family protein [Bacteroidia bacterium]|jgi:outer membrane protein|nr:TolC family protein [Bacteroidia bacterium]
MNIRIKYLLVYISLLIAASKNMQAQDSVKVLLLDDCIKIGLEQSAQILRSQDSLEITGAALVGAYGQYLPNLNFSGNYGYISGSNLLTTAEPTLIESKVSQLNYQLTSTVNIFNGFSNYSTLKAATISNSASQLNLNRAKQQIAFDITQSFLQVILDRRIVDYAQNNLDASTKREAQLQELTSVGRKAMSDLYQQQAETSNDKLFLIQSDNKLKNDIILLLRKIKISQTDKYKIGDMPLDSLPLGPQYQNVQDLIDQALKQRADLQSSALSITRAEWEVKNFQSGYMPRLTFEGGLFSNGGYFNQLYVNGTNELGPQEPIGRALFGQIYGEAALSLSWNIFDRFYNKTNVSIAKVYQRNAQIEFDDLTVQISSDIKQAYNDYISALQQIETANHGLFAASKAFEVVDGEYNVGKATFIELSNAQIVLLQSQVSKTQADFNLALQKKIIDFYIGK